MNEKQRKEVRDILSDILLECMERDCWHDCNCNFNYDIAENKILELIEQSRLEGARELADILTTDAFDINKCGFEIRNTCKFCNFVNNKLSEMGGGK